MPEPDLRTSRADREDIREIVESWVIWRDAGLWDRFRTLWHDDGQMTATWTQSPVDEFIERSKTAPPGAVLHFLGGQTIDLNANRAVSQTKMTISVRGAIGGVACDVVCTGRFYDLLEWRAGRWGLVLRRCIYEKDRADPLDGTQHIAFDRALLDAYPTGYRHLAYMQSQGGFSVRKDLPGAAGPALDALYRAGAGWLAGDPL